MCVCLFRDVDIWMPEMEQQEVPSGWWDTEADRSLLVGVFKHGASVCVCERDISSPSTLYNMLRVCLCVAPL